MKNRNAWLIGFLMGSLGVGGTAAAVGAVLRSKEVRRAEAAVARADSAALARDSALQAAAAATRRAAVADSGRLAAEAVAARARARNRAVLAQLQQRATARDVRASRVFDSLPPEVRRVAGPVVAMKDSTIADERAARDSALSLAASQQLRAERGDSVILLLRASNVAKDAAIAKQAAVIVNLRDAVAAYNKAVHPSWGVKLLGDAKPFLVGALVGGALCEFVLHRNDKNTVVVDQGSYTPQPALRVALHFRP